MAAEFATVSDEQAGLSEVEITSARALNDEDRVALEAQVAKLAGGRPAEIRPYDKSHDSVLY